MTAVSAEAFELSEADISAMEDAPPLRCQWDGCTNGVNKPARGRVPKYCDEHKSARPSTNSKSKSSGKSWTRAAEVETHLTDTVKALGKVAGLFIDETDGEIIQEKGPAVIHELVELAKDDKTLQRYLLWISAPGKYGPLVAACSSLVIPIVVNHKMKAIVQAQEREGGI